MSATGRNIDLKKVRITDPLLGYYQRLVTSSVLPYQYEVLNDRIEGLPPSGAIRNFRVAAGLESGEHIGRVFQDSDVAKWIEAVAYSLTWNPDPALEDRVDEVIDLIGKAQWEDGYLNTYFTVAMPGKRFTNLVECHELYCFGHLAEAAVAWYEATGKRNLLDIMLRYADLICDTFGPGEGQIHGYDGHQEAELALVKLYRVTSEKRYLDMARYFLEERGKQPYFFDDEWEKRGRCYYYYPIPPENRPSDRAVYNQSKIPPAEQSDALGHAVRFAYMCTGMSDVAAETGDQRMLSACRRLWDSAVNRNMYITGAIGSSRHGEAFTFDYDLPNDRTYGETCASIGMIFFANSMMRNAPAGYLGDLMELEIYNVVLAAISLDGKQYFYVNPLEVNPDSCMYDPDMSKVKPVRQKWYTTACCPPNIARLLASLGRYVYFQDGARIYANLYIGSQAEFEVEGQTLRLSMESGLPWNGTVHLTIAADNPVKAALALRVPGWAEEFKVSINGEACAPDIKNGFAVVEATFKTGDRIELTIGMEPTLYHSNPAVRYNAGKAAVKAGPLVYCLEELDNGRHLSALSVTGRELARHNENAAPLAYIAYTAEGRRDMAPQGGPLYFKGGEPRCRNTELKFVPYFLWGSRNGSQPKEMAVWLRDGCDPPCGE